MREFDAIGNLVTGAAAARAAEPHAGEGRGRDGTPGGRCLNCDTTLVGQFCHGCGQNRAVRRSLLAFGEDFLTGVLNFESKAIRTLPLLVWRPGQLTRRYIDGQRARFVSPLALFLFAVFLLFAVIQSIGGPNGMDLGQIGAGGNAYHSTDEALAGETKKLAELRAKQAKQATNPEADAQDRADLAKEIADQQKAVAVLTRFKQDGIANAILTGSDELKTNSSVPFIQEAIERAKANPQLALYKLQDSASKFAWVLIPISVPFLWLLFPFSRRFGLYDHSVFVTYSISFMLLLAAVLSLSGSLGAPLIALAAVFVPPLHMYRQLKGAYALGRWGALWRTGALLTFSTIALGLFAVAVVLLGISG
ncbi:DUF3667 domain-containing protein [Sphingomonas sp. ASV193]|uniref:DUF3667 domain-containing protein n=1 Tax=Sphingomonas sp. ASV193 TaxID=3144405 RepID=UPI0032E910FF